MFWNKPGTVFIGNFKPAGGVAIKRVKAKRVENLYTIVYRGLTFKDLMNVKVKKLHASALLPDRAHSNDAGADLFSLEDVQIPPQSSIKARTGLAVALPAGTAGIVWGKSSLESQGLIVTAGLVDEGYRGEVLVCLFNLTKETKTLAKGQKMAQLLVMPVVYAGFTECDELEPSRRGGGGFGSTGKHKAS